MRGLGLIAGAALLALGVWSAVALGAHDGRRVAATLATTTAITTTGETGDTETAAPMVWVCHHTGSWKHPNHLIHISEHAVHAHLQNHDVLADANNSCPTTGSAEKTHGHGHGHGAHPSDRGHGRHDGTETTGD